MLNWKIKAALFHCLKYMPMGTRLHYMAQRYVTKTFPRDNSHIDALVNVARRYVHDFRNLTVTPLEDAAFLEIGAGRDLIVPLALRLLGVKHVTAVDIERLADIKLINIAARRVCFCLDLPIIEFKNFEELEGYGILYMAPFDLIQSVDIIRDVDAFVSNEVLEHIPAVFLEPLFKSAISKLKDVGISIHSIDYSDHYARDGGVSRFNFLKYSDLEWKKYNPSIHYVNRLRHSDYVSVMKKCGLQIISCDSFSEEIPDKLEISPEFLKYSSDDISILRSRIVAQSLTHKDLH